jgi:hypothetical protein
MEIRKRKEVFEVVVEDWVSNPLGEEHLIKTVLATFPSYKLAKAWTDAQDWDPYNYDFDEPDPKPYYVRTDQGVDWDPYDYDFE